MAFSSQIYTDEPIIDESNAHLLAPPQDVAIDGEAKSRGRQPRDWSKVPYGSMPYAGAFSLPLIPRSEWPDRIAEMERTKSRLSDVILQAGIPSLDQQQTNYCWTNAVVGIVEVIREISGSPYVKLSSASVAAKIKGFRNEGGWGGEALKFIVEHGVAAASLWPANHWQSKQYDTAESQENALKHRVTEWYDLQDRNFNQMMTCLLNRIPVAIGLNWWGHEIYACDPVMPGANSFGARIRNSWSDSYGAKGFAVLTESKATPDDAVAPRVTLPGAV